MRPFFSSILGLAAVIGVTAIITTHANTADALYTPSELRARITQAPQAWVGRTVFVRGVAVGCGSGMLCRMLPTGSPTLALADSITAPMTRATPLQWGPEDSLLAFLRRLPVVGQWAPKPQQLHWGVTAIYRVRVASLPAPACGLGTGNGPCYGLVMLDAVQPSWRPLRVFGFGPVLRPIPLWHGSPQTSVAPLPVRPQHGPASVMPQPYISPQVAPK